jgi:hypothetical protein
MSVIKATNTLTIDSASDSYMRIFNVITYHVLRVVLSDGLARHCVAEKLTV